MPPLGRARSRHRVVALTLLAAAFLAACSGDGEKREAAPPTTAPSTDPKAEITTMWSRFFVDSTPTEEKVRNLENGEAHRADIEQTLATGQTKGVTIEVKEVNVTSPTAATVSYAILLNGEPAVPSATGDAILQDGRWKVTEKVFCVLIQLGGQNPPTCAGKT